MRKNNTRTTVTEQRRRELAKARRKRRQERTSLLVDAKIRSLIVEHGKVMAQLRQLQIENKQLKEAAAAAQPAPAATEANNV